MQDGETTLKECLLEAGYWCKEDGEFGTDEHSLGIVLERMHQDIVRGVLLVFYCPNPGDTIHEARLMRGGQQQTLASGQSFADALCNAALALPKFLKENPECARRQKTG